jgi:hypothetical protein
MNSFIGSKICYDNKVNEKNFLLFFNGKTKINPHFLVLERNNAYLVLMKKNYFPSKENTKFMF